MPRLLLRILPFTLILFAALPSAGQTQTDPKAAAARAQAASREAAKAAAVARAKAAAQEESRAKAAEATAVRSGIYRSVDQVLQAAGGDAKRFEQTLAAGRVQTSLTRICAIASERAVVCTSLDDIARGMRLSPVDDKFMRLGLNEVMRNNGMSEGDQTLYLCMQQGPLIGRQQMGSMPGSGPTTPLGRPSGPGGFTRAAQPTRTGMSGTAADRDALAQRCSGALRGGLRVTPVGAARGGSGYQSAVRSAVSHMDQASSQCYQSGSSPVAARPGGGPSGGTGGPGAGDGGWFDTAVEVAYTGGKVALGVAEVAVAVKQGNLPEAFVAATDLALGTAQDADGMAGGEESAGLGLAADGAGGVSLIITAATAGAGTVAAAGALTVASTVVATGAMAWELGRAIDKVTGVGDYLVNKAIEHQEARDSTQRAEEERARADSANGAGTPDTANGAGTPDTANGGAGARQPGPDGGDKMTCEEMQEAWNRFKAYCSQAGNDWQTYDCAKFVARMNRCADPAVVNPGSEGGYVCRARPTERDKAIYMCEQRQKKQDMIARPVGGGRSRGSCAEQVAFWSNAKVMVQEIAMERQCTKADPGEEGVCAAAPSSGGGAPAPRPRPLGR